MAEFASLDGQNQSIPTSGASTDRLQLTTPNSMITGTMAGLQQIGSPSLTIDSIKNLITVKPVSTTNTQILRYGQVATGFLGMAVNDGVNDTMFAGQDNTGATVVKIAKSGFDAKTASAANLIFNSSQDVFKIVNKIPISFTLNLTAATPATWFGSTSKAHGLTFTPAIFPQTVLDPYFANLSPGGTANQSNPAISYGSSGNLVSISALAEVSVDSTNIYLTVQTGNAPTGSYTFTSTVYLLQETFT